MPHTNDTPDLAVAICTKDNMRTICATLDSIMGLARRIVVVDSGSIDGTIECCQSHGAEVIQRDWHGPTNQKQYAMDQCLDHRWILLLDSDEELQPELRESIRRAVAADDQGFGGWAINRKVWFLGGWLDHTFQPEWRLRLVRSDNFKVVGIGPNGRGGHDRVEVEGRVGRLKGICRHDSWADAPEMCRRQVDLARRAGEHNQGGGTILHIMFSPAATFLKQMLLKRGFLDGTRGLIAACGAAAGVLMKHMFIAQRRAGLWGEEK